MIKHSFSKLLKNPLHIYGEKEGVSITPFLKKIFEKEVSHNKCRNQVPFDHPPKQKNYVQRRPVRTPVVYGFR